MTHRMYTDHELSSYADIPVANVGTLLMHRMREFGDRAALVDGETGSIYTYTELVNRIERTANGLQSMGVAKGDVICIASPNHMDYLVACYAAFLVAATVQPINPTYTKDDIERAVETCNTRFIITAPQLVAKVRAAVTRRPHIKIIVFGKETLGCTSFEALVRSSNSSYTTPNVDPKTAVALLLSSSGTTGFPKAVQLTHFAVMAHVFQSSRRVVRRHDTCLLFLPLFHVYALCTLAITFHFNAATIVIIPKFSLDPYLRLVEKYKPRALNIVPPVVVALAKHPRLSDYDTSSVSDLTCGAAPLSPKIEETIKRRLGLKYITQGYGLTETIASHAAFETHWRVGSVGKSLPLVETKIVDVATGLSLGPNQEGEVWVRGPQTSCGYLGRPTETAQMFLPDGWVRTGDVGKEDEDGFLYIVDRIKELIKYKGFQVAPATLEDILLRHDKVADVGVVGVPDEEAGELPKAYVVKKPGVNLTADELIKFVDWTVPPHMRLRGGVEFIEQLPRSLSGKILRRTLRLRAKTTPSKL